MITLNIGWNLKAQVKLSTTTTAFEPSKSTFTTQGYFDPATISESEISGICARLTMMTRYEYSENPRLKGNYSLNVLVMEEEEEPDEIPFDGD